MGYFSLQYLDNCYGVLVYKCEGCGNLYEIPIYLREDEGETEELRSECERVDGGEYGRKFKIDEIAARHLPKSFDETHRKAVLTLCPDCRRGKLLVGTFNLRRVDVPCCGTCTFFRRFGRHHKGDVARCALIEGYNLRVVSQHGLNEAFVCDRYEASEASQDVELMLIDKEEND